MNRPPPAPAIDPNEPKESHPFPAGGASFPGPNLVGSVPMASPKPPLVGGSWLFGAARDLQRDQLGTYGRALREHGGDLVRFRVGPPRVGIEFDTVFQPDAARQVLATDAACYDKAVPAFDEFRWVMGNGLITSDGDLWRRDRRIVAPLFTRRRVASHVGTMSLAAARLVSSWEDTARRGGQVDLQDSGMHYALDVLGQTVFGDDVERLVPVLRGTVPLLSDFAARRALSAVRVPHSWPTPANRRADRARRQLWGVVDELIANRRKAATAGDDLLGLLLTAHDPETGATLDDPAVRDQALTFLIAGHETTGTTLAFALSLLGRHDAEQERVREEVRTVVGDGDLAGTHLDGLRYTAQVVNEALRLFPSGHTIVRHAHQPASISGHEVPAGRVVAISVWGIHHNPDVWPNPEHFDPGRFDPSHHEGDPDSQGTRYAHLPFGGGPRGCIGQHLAMAELVVAVASVVRAFRLESAAAEPELDVAATLRPRGELLCRLRPV